MILHSHRNALFLHFFSASDKFWCLLITFANSLNPNQDRQNVGPGLCPICFVTLILFLIFFGEKIILQKVSRQQKKNHEKIPYHAERHEIAVLLPNPFDEILSSVPCMELLWTMHFCCKIENFTKSAQFWSQNVPLVLTKKTSTHTLCF